MGLVYKWQIVSLAVVHITATWLHGILVFSIMKQKCIFFTSPTKCSVREWPCSKWPWETLQQNVAPFEGNFVAWWLHAAGDAVDLARWTAVHRVSQLHRAAQRHGTMRHSHASELCTDQPCTHSLPAAIRIQRAQSNSSWQEKTRKVVRRNSTVSSAMSVMKLWIAWLCQTCTVRLPSQKTATQSACGQKKKGNSPSMDDFTMILYASCLFVCVYFTSPDTQAMLIYYFTAWTPHNRVQ